MAIETIESPMVIADCQQETLRSKMLHSESEAGDQSLSEGPLAGAVVIALRTSDCFGFSKTVSERKRLKNRKQIVYELEEYLPIDADDLSIARVESRGGLLIVATDSESIKPLVARLEATGKYVASISPIAFLAVASLRRQLSLKTVDHLVWQSSEGLDVMELHQGIPISWEWHGDHFAVADGKLKEIVSGQTTGRIAVIDGDDNLVETFANAESCVSIELNREQAAEAECARIALGSTSPIADLRDGPLASSNPHQPISRSLKTFVAVLLAFQICVVGSLFLLRKRYQHQSDEHIIALEQAFQETFPDEAIPVGIVARLESEHRRLAGTRGVAGRKSPELRSAIPVTHAFLASMPEPADSTFVIDRLEFASAGVLNLSGTAKSYADLEFFAERLRIGGLAVPPVSATATSGGVSLRFDFIPHIRSQREGQ
ncbi:hypothetical protein K227x_58550 [Rubripirellula lacrimiformis]|uniref:GspL periplasmic domain protein n=2 Tax=Rubripirellula lacrimiformis TaxID=1930273 RepID=A0A517NJX3_9BACT|nr:hypothetical protein K227x_58550 [Rubripirellula lacrimiformis]